MLPQWFMQSRMLECYCLSVSDGISINYDPQLPIPNLSSFYFFIVLLSVGAYSRLEYSRILEDMFLFGCPRTFFTFHFYLPFRAAMRERSTNEPVLYRATQPSHSYTSPLGNDLYTSHAAYFTRVNLNYIYSFLFLLVHATLYFLFYINHTSPDIKNYTAHLHVLTATLLSSRRAVRRGQFCRARRDFCSKL